SRSVETLPRFARVWPRARAPRITRTRHSFGVGCVAAVCWSDRMATQAAPGNQAPDIRAGGVRAPGAHQAGIQGRESELRTIGGSLGEVACGSGGVIVVEGASGIGKSRLLLEGVRDAKRRGMRFGVSMAEPAERAVEDRKSTRLNPSHT